MKMIEALYGAEMKIPRLWLCLIQKMTLTTSQTSHSITTIQRMRFLALSTRSTWVLRKMWTTPSRMSLQKRQLPATKRSTCALRDMWKTPFWRNLQKTPLPPMKRSTWVLRKIWMTPSGWVCEEHNYHSQEHMGTTKDVDNTIPDVCVKNTTTIHEEEVWVLRKMCTTSARMSIRKRSHTKFRTRNPAAPRKYMKILLSTASHVSVNNEVGNSRGVPPVWGGEPSDVVLLASDDEVPLSSMQKGVKLMKEMISSQCITSTRKY